MAVRKFDGTDDDLITATGALSGMQYGTVAALFKRDSLGVLEALLALNDSGGNSTFELFLDDLNHQIGIWNGSDTSQAIAIDSTSDWFLCLLRKDGGASTVGISVYDYSTGIWTHATDDALADWSAPGVGGSTAFSFDEGSGEFFAGRIAARAAWSNSLPFTADASGDSDIEAAGLETHLSNWFAHSPDALWAFNQASTGDPVNDLTGNGADQTSITGTTVVTGDDPPGFNFELEPVREFDGSDDDLIADIGSLSTMTYGTTAALIKLNDTGTTFLSLDDSGGTTVLQFSQHSASERPRLAGAIAASGTGALATNTWYIVLARKPTGSENARFSVYDFGTASWSHADSLANENDWSAPGGSGSVGFSIDGDDGFFSGLVAVRAVWSNSVPWSADSSGDSAIEALGLETSLQNWVGQSPDALWTFNQDVKTAVVESVVSGGSGTANLQLANPSGVTVGDLLIATPGNRFSTAAVSPDEGGWTSIAGAGNGGRVDTFSRVYSSGGPWNFTCDDLQSIGAIVRITGAGSVVDSATDTGTGTTATAPSVDAGSGGGLLLTVFHVPNNTTIASPGSMTEQWNNLNAGGASTRNVQAGASERVGAGATGTRSATLGTSSNWIAVSILIEDAIPAVADLTGNGADEISRVGTTVITNDPVPGFSYEFQFAETGLPLPPLVMQPMRPVA